MNDLNQYNIMERKEISIRIEGNAFYIDDYSRSNRFKCCSFEDLYDVYYCGDLPFRIFKRLIKLSFSQFFFCLFAPIQLLNYHVCDYYYVSRNILPWDRIGPISIC